MAPGNQAMSQHAPRLFRFMTISRIPAPESIMQSSTVLAVVYAVGGSVFLPFFMGLLKVHHQYWEPILASIASGLCQWLLPPGVNGLMSWVAPLVLTRLTTNGSWADLAYCTIGTRIVLVPIYFCVMSGGAFG